MMKTCLVVDDSSVIRKVARRILEGLQFEIVEAAAVAARADRTGGQRQGDGPPPIGNGCVEAVEGQGEGGELGRIETRVLRGLDRGDEDVIGPLGNGVEHIDDWAGASMAASFTQHTAGGDMSSRQFIWPPTFDLSPVVERGDVVILAYLPGDSLVPAMNQFAALRQAKGTLVRLVIPQPR